MASLAMLSSVGFALQCLWELASSPLPVNSLAVPGSPARLPRIPLCCQAGVLWLDIASFAGEQACILCRTCPTLLLSAIDVVWVETHSGLVGMTALQPFSPMLLPHCIQEVGPQTILWSVNGLAWSCSCRTTLRYSSCWSRSCELKPGLGLPTLGVERDWQSKGSCSASSMNWAVVYVWCYCLGSAIHPLPPTAQMLPL